MTRPPLAPAITSSHVLLTDAWTADVKALQAALGRITDAPEGRDCRVTFFEVPGDRELHVSVTHQYPTDDGAGARPTPHGIVPDRTFVRMPRYQVLRQIRDMVFPAES